MTLNEAIERAKEKAAELRERNCIECAVEHEQLATWLEELSKFQWIPVKERLPECGEHYESNDVLVSVDYRPDDPEETKDTFVSIDHVCFNCFEQGEFSIERDNPYDTEPSPYFVIAWLPLPEPYTAKVEDDDNARRVKPLEFDRFKNDTLKDAQPTAPAHWEKADIPLPYQVRTVPTPSGTFAHREMYVCSACDGYNDKNTQYCPHCGAKMDRKDGNG